jgi:3-oxoacyl-[acyl-carrier protein] reductase
MDKEALASAQKQLAAKGKVMTAVVDVTNAPAVDGAVADTLRQLGAIDILVNNAGIAGATIKTWEYTPEQWRQVIEIDLVGPFICARAVVPHMMSKKYGRIVNIASIAGKEGNPNASAYSAAKAGLIGFTKSLGKELATSGIAVNCITPAAAKTDIFKQISQEHVDFMLSKIPMGRLLLVEEIGAMVAWLASEDCSFTTGGVFDISGGRATY